MGSSARHSDGFAGLDEVDAEADDKSGKLKLTDTVLTQSIGFCGGGTRPSLPYPWQGRDGKADEMATRREEARR